MFLEVHTTIIDKEKDT